MRPRVFSPPPQASSPCAPSVSCYNALGLSGWRVLLSQPSNSFIKQGKGEEHGAFLALFCSPAALLLLTTRRFVLSCPRQPLKRAELTGREKAERVLAYKARQQTGPHNEEAGAVGLPPFPFPRQAYFLARRSCVCSALGGASLKNLSASRFGIKPR